MKNMYKPDEVGKRLRMLRKRRGYSREKIAQNIGRSAKYYADIERGTCGMSLETLIGLADFYHVSLDYLVDGAEPDARLDAGAVWDEETGWMVKRLGELNGRKREVVLQMMQLILEEKN